MFSLYLMKIFILNWKQLIQKNFEYVNNEIEYVNNEKYKNAVNWETSILYMLSFRYLFNFQNWIVEIYIYSIICIHYVYTFN